MPNVMTLSKMQTLLFAAALLCIFLTNLSCNNNVSITTEETPQKRIIASCDNGLLKKSNCIDTDDGTTEEANPTPTTTPLPTFTPTVTPTATPTTIPSPPQFIDTAVGRSHSCGISEEGLLYCWGSDSGGQLGNGAGLTADQGSPSAVDISGMTGEKAFIKVVAGREHTCALTAQGKAWCWGADTYGILGNGAGSTTAKDVPSAVDTAGMSGEKAFMDLVIGYYTTCGLTAEGKAWCWGDGTDGQMGNNTGTTINESPVAVTTTGMTGEKAFTKLAMGAIHVCGLTTEGKAWCWGDNAAGKLGDGTQNPSDVPVAVDISGMSGEKAFTDIAGGGDFTCAITAEGKVWCWGDDGNGQLGDGAVLTGNRTTPSPLDIAGMTGDKNFTQISLGAQHTCALTAQGIAWCWGQDTDGKLGNGAVITAEQSSPSAVDTSTITGSTTFIKIASEAFSNHTCGITSEGKVWCWGRNTNGQLGGGAIGGSQSSPYALDITGLNAGITFSRVGFGAMSACGITSAGKIYCWGSELHGELGNGAAGNQTSPYPIDTTPLAGEQPFVEIAAGMYYYCALTAEGKVWCWGYDSSGQLGNGATTGDQASPVALDVSGIASSKVFVSLTAAWMHVCGIASDGKAWCWGDDYWGQLGNGAGSSADQPSPTLVDTSGIAGEKSFVNIEAGGYASNCHTCAITADGKPWCWGSDSSGQLGNGAGITGNQSTPSPVDTSTITGEKSFIKVSGGRTFTCGLTKEGKAYCWGNGSAIVSSKVSPFAADVAAVTGEKAFVSIVAGESTTCALTGEGKVWCWGGDNAGVLGDGAGVSGTMPVTLDTSTISGEKSIRHIMTAQEQHVSCGITSQGKLYCWGYDSYGQIGNGATTGNQESPAAVDVSGM